MNQKMVRFKKPVTILLAFFIVGVVITGAADIIVTDSAKGRLYSDAVENMPHRKVGLLLGTSKTLDNGKENQYYQNRLIATIELFNQGKIDYVLVSGDKHGENYDEPTAMKNDLIKGGVPEQKIKTDYAGFRTIDSIMRCKQVFNENEITIISQRFHNERAIYLALHNDVDAIGYNAKDVTVYYGFKTQLREKLARVKMFLDLAFK